MVPSIIQQLKVFRTFFQTFFNMELALDLPFFYPIRNIGLGFRVLFRVVKALKTMTRVRAKIMFPGVLVR
jgi:hypothetical protein